MFKIFQKKPAPKSFEGLFWVKSDDGFCLKNFILKAKDEGEAREMLAKQENFFCVCKIKEED